jgi:3-hydroxybutyryl-CoA dehydrogenase
MGPDIALGFALGGYEVTGVDIEQMPLERAAQKISADCRQMTEMGMIRAPEASEIQSRITLTLEWEESVAGSGYITEAVPEEMETKQQVFRQCGDLCSERVVIASNTSSMSITQIASKMRFPERAITTHWTIPAHLSPMVEVIRGEKTAAETEKLTLTLLSRIGKRPVSCRDNPGFVHNYIQFAMVKAALDLVEDGIASAEDVDTVVKNGFGLRIFSVGPIQFIDMCGLDTFLNIQKYMHNKTSNPVFRPSALIREKVLQGELGVKSGRGFYTYAKAEPGKFWAKTNLNIMKVLKALRK